MKVSWNRPCRGFPSVFEIIRFDIYSTCNFTMSASQSVFLPFFQGLIHSVIFKFADVIIQKTTLISTDTIPLSSAIWGDISREGTSEEGVRVNFPGLGSRPSLSSHVTVLGFSLEKPAVIILAVLPGQSQCNSRMKMWKPGSRVEWRVQEVASSQYHSLSVNSYSVITGINCWILFADKNGNWKPFIHPCIVVGWSCPLTTKISTKIISRTWSLHLF